MTLNRRQLITATLASVFAASTATVAHSFGLSPGWYTVEGRNPDGTSYSGTVNLQRRGDVVFMRWDIAGRVYTGQGTLDGQVLTVDWGDTTPVIYVIQPNGVLHGTWSNGRASEKLTPR